MKRLSLIIILIIYILTGISFLIADDTEIKILKHKIKIETDNSADIEIFVDFGCNSRDTILIPLTIKSATNLKVTDSTGFNVSFVKQNTIQYIQIIRRPNCTDSTITIFLKDMIFFDFDNTKQSDFGNYTLNYKFTNTVNWNINKFITQIFLPYGYVITSVEDSYPKLTNKNPESPYEVLQVNNRNGAEIKNSKMILGNNCMIKFRFKKDSKSSFLFFSFLIIAALYLIFFRDLIKNKNNNQKPNNNVNTIQ